MSGQITPPRVRRAIRKGSSLNAMQVGAVVPDCRSSRSDAGCALRPLDEGEAIPCTEHVRLKWGDNGFCDAHIRVIRSPNVAFIRTPVGTAGRPGMTNAHSRITFPASRITRPASRITNGDDRITVGDPRITIGLDRIANGDSRITNRHDRITR